MANELPSLRSIAGTLLACLPGLLSRSLLINPRGMTDLPLELICTIFSMLPFADRVRIALVSKAWRAIAIECAPLWADLRNVRTTCLLPVLARSRSAPVKFSMADIQVVEFDIVCEVIGLHIGHIAHLDLSFSLETHTDLSPLVAALKHPAPMLKVLRLESGHERLTMSKNLFEGHAPRLCFVHLDGFDLPGPCTAMARVTSFSARATWSSHTQNGQERTRMMAYTTRLNEFFPSLQQLRLTDLQHVTALVGPQFPTHLAALELDFDPDFGEADEKDSRVMSLLSHAHLSDMITLVLKNPPDDVVPRVVAETESAEWMLLEGPGQFDVEFDVVGDGSRLPWANMRVISRSLATRNFLSCARLSLDNCLVQPSFVSDLVELVLGPYFLDAFSPSAIATMFVLASRLEILTIILSQTQEDVMPTLRGWTQEGQVLLARNLRELRLSAPSGPTSSLFPVDTRDVLSLLGQLRLGTPRLHTLSVYGIELEGDGSLRLAAEVENIQYHSEDFMTMMYQDALVTRTTALAI